MSSKCKFFYMLVISYYHTKFPQIIKAAFLNSDRMLLQEKKEVSFIPVSPKSAGKRQQDLKKKSIYIFLRLAGQNARRRGNGV